MSEPTPGFKKAAEFGAWVVIVGVAALFGLGIYTLSDLVL